MNPKEKYVLDKYDVTEDGRVYSHFTNKYLRLRTDKDGYKDVSLVYNNNGNRMPFRVHRLMALKFLPQKIGHDVVNHKDLNKANNVIDNLEWSTVKLNTQHGYNYSAYKNIKKVKVTDSDGNVLVFPSTSHASRYYGYANPSTIQAILEGRRNNPIPKGSRKGLFFEYTDEGVTTIERVSVAANRE